MSKVKTIYTDEYISLIKALTHERQRLGLSQEEVSEHLEIKQSDISKIENIERRLDIIELKKLLKIYRIDENLKLKNKFYSFFGMTVVNNE